MGKALGMDLLRRGASESVGATPTVARVGAGAREALSLDPTGYNSVSQSKNAEPGIHELPALSYERPPQETQPGISGERRNAGAVMLRAVIIEERFFLAFHL